MRNPGSCRGAFVRMRVAAVVAASLSVLLVGSGCAYVGAPLPPALNIPVAVSDLVAVQYGDNLLVRFTIPDQTTDAIPLTELQRVELILGPDPQPSDTGFNSAAWMASARHLDLNQSEPGPVEFTTPAAPFLDQEIILGVLLHGPTGRLSDLSNFDTINVARPLQQPTNVAAENVVAGIRVSWQGSEARYRVLRSTGESEDLQPVGEVGTAEFVDQGTAYGTEYRYLVVAIAEELQQSLPSSVVAITPRDEFPPAVPQGLSAVPGPQSVELAWARNTDPDFLSYSIYRAPLTADGTAGEFAALATGVGTPNFSDPNVTSDMTYRYAVAAVDLLGNESEPSMAIDVTVP